MIEIEPLSGNCLKLVAPEKLSVEDFVRLAPQADALIEQFGSLRLLIDAGNMAGWESPAAIQHHIAFVKSRHRHVERIAVIVSHDWQRWVAKMASTVLHPEIKTFHRNEDGAAVAWLMG